MAIVVEHEKRQIRQWHTDRTHIAFGVRGGDLTERDVHRRLGDPVHVDQTGQPRVFGQP